MSLNNHFVAVGFVPQYNFSINILFPTNDNPPPFTFPTYIHYSSNQTLHHSLLSISYEQD